MGGPDVYARIVLRIDPSAENPAARKHEGMRAVPIEDGQFKMAVERRA